MMSPTLPRAALDDRNAAHLFFFICLCTTTLALLFIVRLVFALVSIGAARRLLRDERVDGDGGVIESRQAR